MAIAKVSEQTGMDPQTLQAFSLLELQVLPSILQKISSMPSPQQGQGPQAQGRTRSARSAISPPKGREMAGRSPQQGKDDFAREIPMKSPARGRQPVMR
jgi:hypothetical protein